MVKFHRPCSSTSQTIKDLGPVVVLLKIASVQIHQVAKIKQKMLSTGYRKASTLYWCIFFLFHLKQSSVYHAIIVLHKLSHQYFFCSYHNTARFHLQLNVEIFIQLDFRNEGKGCFSEVLNFIQKLLSLLPLEAPMLVQIFFNGFSRPLFLFIFVFLKVNSKYVNYKILPITGFEPQTSGIGSDRQ